jgi:oligopeptide/dipeptide ABC transporter ATP-binding protein
VNPRSEKDSEPALLEVEGLETNIVRRRGTVQAVAGISLRVERGETVGLVGESGCGKTMTAMSIIRLLPPGGQIAAGSVRLLGRELLGLRDTEMRRVRGKQVGVVFQDPMTSLNPTSTIGRQVAEAVRIHEGASKAAARRRAEEVLGLVGMPRPAERLDDFPHQLSGGLRQRAMIAIALACEPALLIADEPTTALDVTIQAQILELLDDLKSRLGMGMLLVTHDMGVIAGRADRVVVMYAGKVVEAALTDELFATPLHPYTEALLGAVPRLEQDRSQPLYSIPGLPPDLSHPPAACRFAPRCRYATERCTTEQPMLGGPSPAHPYACFHPRIERVALPDSARRSDGIRRVSGAEAAAVLRLQRVTREYPVTTGFLHRTVGTVKAVSDVSFSVQPGETFGLVGESGCGKTTLGKLIVASERPDHGSVIVNGTQLGSLSQRELRRKRREVQLVFQDASSSLDPRMRVGASLLEPLRVQRVGTKRTRAKRVAELLDAVGLPANAADRYPHELSGGQRQRVGFARALALSPELVVADEPVSSLDVSIQAQLINLMTSLQHDFGLTYVVISHDLSVVKYVADHIGVMYLGKLVEIGPSSEIYERPAHPYTAGLLASIPVPDPATERSKRGSHIGGELPSAVNPPTGCRFRTRCPFVEELCGQFEPPLRAFGDDRLAACHFPLVPAAAEAAEGTNPERAGSGR